MSVNNSFRFFRSHIVKVGGSVCGRSLHLHHLPDQPGSVGRCSCSLRTNQPGFFVSIFSSQITGNEVLISYRNQTAMERLD